MRNKISLITRAQGCKYLCRAPFVRARASVYVATPSPATCALENHPLLSEVESRTTMATLPRSKPPLAPIHRLTSYVGCGTMGCHCCVRDYYFSNATRDIIKGRGVGIDRGFPAIGSLCTLARPQPRRMISFRRDFGAPRPPMGWLEICNCFRGLRKHRGRCNPLVKTPSSLSLQFYGYKYSNINIVIVVFVTHDTSVRKGYRYKFVEGTFGVVGGIRCSNSCDS